MTVTIQTHFTQGRRGRRLIQNGKKREQPQLPTPTRLARLMALAIKYDDLLKRGELRDHAQLARIHGLDPGLISRLMMLRLLAPDIQEAVLGLTSDQSGTELQIKHLLPVTRIADWDEQRRLGCDLSVRAANLE